MASGRGGGNGIISENLAKQRAIVRSKREVPDRELKQVVRNVGYRPVTVEDLK